MKSSCITFFLLCVSSCLFSQNYIYKEFGINDGLPNLEVHQLHQDKNGLIWFATDRGMANYNGYNIQKFDLETSISNAVVLDLFPQTNGKIYAATFNNELFYFNDIFDGFHPYKYNHILREILEFKNHIINVYEDENENLHIACENMHGVLIISKEGKISQDFVQITSDKKLSTWIKLEKKDTSKLFFSYADTNQVKENTVTNVKLEYLYQNVAILLSDTNFIILTDGKKIKIQNDKGELVKIIESDKTPIVLKALTSTTFFVGYDFGGGCIMDVDGNIYKHFLPEKSVSDFLIDNEGGYWFSTLHSGVFYIKAPEIKVLNTAVKSPIVTLTKASGNDLYIGHRTGEVLRLTTDKKILPEAPRSDLSPAVEFDEINELLYVKAGDLFYTKDASGKRSFFSDSLSESFHIKMSEPLGNKIIFSNQTGFRIIKGKDSYKHIDMSFRTHDVVFWDDTYYIGTPLGAYMMKNGEKKSLSEISPLFNYRVDDIDINMVRNELYFATLGNGIIVYNTETEKARAITATDGLLSNTINELYVENEDELWVCTNSGLNKIRFTADDTFSVSSFNSANGFVNDAINDVEIINDTVWIASNKGLMYAPKKLFDGKITENTYHLRIKNIHVNDSVFQQDELKNLSYTQNRIEFFVEGTHFKAHDELHYQYIMEGLDTKWYTTKNRRISYPALPYGKYTFKVAATTLQSGEKLTFLEIPIQIQAPFWKQTWFIISVIVAIVLLIYLFFKYRILSYNQHIIRELLRLWMKKIKRKELYFSFKEAGKEIRIKTHTILYVKSAGNYVEVVTEQKKYTIRTKIGDFINLMPDPLEYLRIHRSYIVRIDKVAEKNSKEVTINNEKIPVSNSYVTELENLIF
jgi:ligand-binding sensor domain-containing protein